METLRGDKDNEPDTLMFYNFVSDLQVDIYYVNYSIVIDSTRVCLVFCFHWNSVINL